jgi:glutaredoxin 3
MLLKIIYQIMQKITLYTATVIIYTISHCPYCIKAKALFNRKNVSYQEINIENDDKLRELVIEKSGGRKTVPQIFINDISIGGCDDLYELEKQGKLDKMLSE